MENIKEEIVIKEKTKDEKKISLYMLFWSIMLLIAGICAKLIFNEQDVLDSLIRMWLSPSKLVTDYFNVGSISSTFINASLCGLGCNLMVFLTKSKKTSVLLAGYFLVIAHCFYGLNFVNMWLPFLSIFLYALCTKKKIGEVLHLSMFMTSLAPFISDFLFRYTFSSEFEFGVYKVSILGIIISIVFSILAGFIIPALLNGMTKMHRGHNLYKAGLAIGFFGFFAHALFYKTFNITTPDSVIKDDPNYINLLPKYGIFVIIFFLVMFIITFLLGLLLNKGKLKGYNKILKCDGWMDDFNDKFGFNLTLVNIGIYGFSLLVILSILVLSIDTLHFTGPVAGALIAAITFSASGQTIKNVWPILVGYLIFFVLVFIVCRLTNIFDYSLVVFQSYVSAFAFATGLCPFSGRYGTKVGIIAGLIDAIIATSTITLHGGFVLYNGGFTAGLTAMLLICILDFYHIEPKLIED